MTPPLSRREKQVIELLIRDLTIGQIALELGISRQTVYSYIYNFRRKLGCQTNVTAVIKALKEGLIIFSYMNIGGNGLP